MTDTDVPDALSKLGAIRDTMAVRRVFGEPYRLDGVELIPVASIRGGGGVAGGGASAEESDEVEGRAGLGFAVDARPVGVLVVKDGKVKWRPTVDVTRVVLNGQQIGLSAMTLLVVVLLWRVLIGHHRHHA